jgi:hypothetical protein
MRYKVEMDTTDSSDVYKKSRKRVLNRTGEISCSYCHYHRGENAKRHYNIKSWKLITKAPKQYKKKSSRGILTGRIYPS